MGLSGNGEKTRIVIIAVCSLIFVGIVIAEVIGFTSKSGRGEPRRNEDDNDNDNNNDDKDAKLSDSVKAIKSICQPTDFKRTCEEEICIEARDSTDVKEIVRAAFKAGVKFATHAVKNSTSLREHVKNPRSQLALEDCRLLLTYSVFELHKAINKVDELELGNFDKVLEDLKIMLSATITNQQTCLHGFRNASTVYEEHMRKAMMMSMRLSTIGLTITCGLYDMVNQLEFQGISHRLLGNADWSYVSDENPRKRRLLQGKGVQVLGHMDSSSMMDKNPWQRNSDTEQGSLIRGHEDLSSLLDESSLWKRRLLQEKEVRVLGHMDSSSMMDKNPWQRNSDTEQGRRIQGHEDLSSLLDESNRWKRRLLREKESYIDGYDGYATILDKRHVLQEKEPDNGHYVYVDGHDDYDTTLAKRRLLQEKEPDNGHYVYVDGHDDYVTTLGKRRLLQEKEHENGNYVYVDGHDDYGTTLDKRRLLQEKEPDNGHYVYVDGHDDYGTTLDKRRLLQEKEPDNGHYIYVDGHDDYGTTLNKRRLLQKKESYLNGHTNYVDGHNDYNTVLDKHHLLEENDPSRLKPDVVVAKDGSGDFKTIEDAISRIHHNGQKPFVIYIKEGIYEENIIFNYNMTNIALIGDGKEKTRITGSLDFADGLNTFNTATVAVHGDFFFAKNIGIENTSGAAKFQAVALMVISDFAVLYNCSIDGHQNTLYVHSKRQFYRDCTVSGTIDFVFGDAAAVFQNCKFVVRKPLEGQKNVITAQGRSDERQPTGIIIQNSTIVADNDFVNLKNSQPTFLGCPRGNFSRTIIMETFIDDLIDPAGWTVGDDRSTLKTSHLSEYNNRGPGSDMTGRVTWSAIKKLSPTEAHGFTLRKFFLDDDWIKEKGIPCTSGFSESQTRKLNMKVPFVLAADN